MKAKALFDRQRDLHAIEAIQTQLIKCRGRFLLPFTQRALQSLLEKLTNSRFGFGGNLFELARFQPFELGKCACASAKEKVIRDK